MTSDTPTILVVDDNAPFRHLMAAFLNKAGYQTALAADVIYALEVLTQKKIDCILLDLQMMPMGGFGFMQEYIELKYTAPVILITGDDSSDILTRSSKLGFAGLLKKPVSESRIIQIVERTLAMQAA
jgi:DNA-binding NtrC family response regulator